MTTSSSLSPEERVAVAVKITEEFDQAIDAVKTEYDDLIKNSIKENDERLIGRLREKIKSFFAKR